MTVIETPRTTALTPPTERPRATGVTRSAAARIAGIGYVLLFALAIFANFLVVDGLVVTDDATATVANITQSMTTFRWGLVAFLAVFIIDIVVAWALHIVFRTVDHDVSLLTAWSRLVYTVFLGVGLVYFFQVIGLLGGSDHVIAMGTTQVEGQVMLALQSFESVWLIGLVAFGLHLVLLGSLVIRSGLVTKALGAVLIAAGVAYVIDTVAHAVMPNYADYDNLFLAMVALPSMFGEGWFGLWLLTRAGRRLSA